MRAIHSRIGAGTAALLSVLAFCGRAAIADPPPLGATYHAGEATFRVWAPFVEAVAVEINDGPPIALQKEPNHPDPADATWAVTLTQVAPGDRYRYAITFEGRTANFIDPRAQQLTGSTGAASAVVVDPSFDWQDSTPPAYRTPTFNEMVIYELHIGSFSRSTTDGKFNLAGAIEKLDYLQQLGVNAVEVLPVHENPEFRDHSPPEYDWGYDPVQLFAVESSYGAPRDLKEFVKQCHKRGIAVVVDVVYNHLSPSSLLTKFGGWSNATNGDGIYFYDDSRRDTGFGPRLDYGRPQVRSYIQDNALTYLREYRVDGLRWDSTINIRAMNNDPINRGLPDGVKVIKETNDAYRNGEPKQPEKIAIAEDLQSAGIVTNPTICEPCLGFNSQWDDGLYYSLRSAVSQPLDGSRNIFDVKQAIEKKVGGDVFGRVIYSENHDKVGHPDGEIRIPRAIDWVNPTSVFARKRSTLAAAIVLTSPGIPMIFQGQEMLDVNNFEFSKRTPVEWDRTEKYGGIVRMYRDMIALRRNLAGTTRGLTAQNLNVYHLNDKDKVIGYHRYDRGGAGDDVVVVANLSNQSFPSYNLGFPREGGWKVRFNSGASVYDREFKGGDSFDTSATAGPKDGMRFNGNVGLGPYAVIILSQDA